MFHFAGFRLTATPPHLIPLPRRRRRLQLLDLFQRRTRPLHRLFRRTLLRRLLLPIHSLPGLFRRRPRFHLLDLSQRPPRPLPRLSRRTLLPRLLLPIPPPPGLFRRRPPV